MTVLKIIGNEYYIEIEIEKISLIGDVVIDIGTAYRLIHKRKNRHNIHRCRRSI